MSKEQRQQKSYLVCWKLLSIHLQQAAEVENSRVLIVTNSWESWNWPVSQMEEMDRDDSLQSQETSLPYRWEVGKLHFPPAWHRQPPSGLWDMGLRGDLNLHNYDVRTLDLALDIIIRLLLRVPVALLQCVAPSTSLAWVVEMVLNIWYWM